MSKKRIKQYLMLLTVVGLVAIAAGGGNGTFASFNAEVTNPGNTFATGDLLLSNTANGGSACISSQTFNAHPSVNNVQGNCDAVLTLNAKSPGSPIATGTVVVQNTGSIAGTKLWLRSLTACNDTQVVNLTFNVTTGNPLCGATLLYVQETAQSGVGETGEGAFTYCWYGNGAGTSTCTVNTTTLNSDTTDTLTHFNTVATSPGIRLYPLSASGTTDTANTIPDLAPSASRSFTVGIYLPNTVANQNPLMDLQSSFDMTWHIDQ